VGGQILFPGSIQQVRGLPVTAVGTQGALAVFQPGDFLLHEPVVDGHQPASGQSLGGLTPPFRRERTNLDAKAIGQESGSGGLSHLLRNQAQQRLGRSFFQPLPDQQAALRRPHAPLDP
jgi:hypothetical protein